MSLEEAVAYALAEGPEAPLDGSGNPPWPGHWPIRRFPTGPRLLCSRPEAAWPRRVSRQ